VNSGGEANDSEPSREPGVPPELLEAARSLAEALESTDVTEAVVEREGARIRIRRSVPRPGPGAGDPPAHGLEPRGAAEPRGAHSVRAPLAGIFYRAPSLNADPYMREGDWLEPTSVVGLIEAMKVFNEITADTNGRVLRFAVDTGTLVQAGDVLLHVDPTASPA
jgi:biotin carboxyl carrier protein